LLLCFDIQLLQFVFEVSPKQDVIDFSFLAHRVEILLLKAVESALIELAKALAAWRASRSTAESLEAVRKDELREWWDRWGTWVVAGAVLVVVAVAGLVGWRQYDTSRRAEVSATDSAALAQITQDPAADTPSGSLRL
jgi:hypothetical protein